MIPLHFFLFFFVSLEVDIRFPRNREYLEFPISFFLQKSQRKKGKTNIAIHNNIVGYTKDRQGQTKNKAFDTTLLQFLSGHAIRKVRLFCFFVGWEQKQQRVFNGILSTLMSNTYLLYQTDKNKTEVRLATGIFCQKRRIRIQLTQTAT